jgi:hypothetical protein
MQRVYRWALAMNTLEEKLKKISPEHDAWGMMRRVSYALWIA